MPITAEEFETARPHLLSVAYRMLGSAHDAQDAVQATWLRAATTRTSSPIENPPAWLRTVTASVCLDQLRARRRRNETLLLAESVPADQLSADEVILRNEDVSRALMVVLNQLTPPQRIAYVLHDLFSVPFEHIATVLGGTTLTAKKHASRGRQRLAASPVADAPSRPDREIVEAFLEAARTGDTRAMVRMLAPDSVRDADAALLPPGVRPRISGADAVATETRHFRDRIQAACALVVNGEWVHVIAPGAHPLATIAMSISDHLITHITLRSAQPGDTYTAAEPSRIP